MSRLPLRWEDPPRALTKAEEFEAERPGYLGPLREERPGQWAVIAEFSVPTKASSLAAKIRRGDVEPFVNDGNGKFEAQQHTAPGAIGPASREVTVYARYILFERD